METNCNKCGQILPRCPECGQPFKEKQFAERGKHRCTVEAFAEFYDENKVDITMYFPPKFGFQDYKNPNIRIIIEKARICFGYSVNTSACDIYFRLHDRWIEAKEKSIARDFEVKAEENG